MKRVAIFSAAALLLTAWSPLPAGPSASGAGHFDLDGANRTFSFTAVTHKDGSVSGQAELHNRTSDATIHLEIDCLRIAGGWAFMSGTVTNSNVDTEGMTGYFAVQDNGQGKNSPADVLTLLAQFDPASNVDCSLDIPLPAYAITGGNVQVRP